VDLRVERQILEDKLEKFRTLHSDLQRCEPRIVSLQEAADQLELQYDGDENEEVRLCPNGFCSNMFFSNMFA
jgi:hypothetical protein